MCSFCHLTELVWISIFCCQLCSAVVKHILVKFLSFPHLLQVFPFTRLGFPFFGDNNPHFLHVELELVLCCGGKLVFVFCLQTELTVSLVGLLLLIFSLIPVGCRSLFFKL